MNIVTRLRAFISIVLVCIFMQASAVAQDELDEVAPSPVMLPDTAAGRHMEWVLRVINAEIQLGDPTARFADRFLEDFKPGELAGELASIHKDGLDGRKALVVSVDQNDNEESLTVTIRGEGTKRFLSVFLALDSKLEKISGLVVNIAMGFDGESVWDSLDGELGNAKGQASFAAYEIVELKTPGRPTRHRLSPVHVFGEDKALPIASAFKIWVLGALAERIDSGALSWDDRVVIQDQWRSLPSGRMRDDPPGTRHRVRELARAMIAESDNTATDHLIHLVGRERVEAFMRAVTADAELNTPLLTTREMFTLKLPMQPWVRDEFLESPSDARRDMLAPGGRMFRAAPDELMLRYWKKPVLVSGAEWFASCEDLCRAMMRIHELRHHAPLAEALAAGHAAKLDPAVWKFVGYKGGSEPGVLSFCSIATRADGRTFVMAAIQASETDALDETPFKELARRGFRLLERFE